MAFKQQFLFEGKKIFLQQKSIELTRSMYQGQGTDGEVYKVSPTEAVKLYKDPDSAEEVKNKLSILCQKANTFHDSVIAPRDFVFLQNGAVSQLRGFSMRFVTNAATLKNYVWKPSVTPEEEKLFDQTVADILCDLCVAIRAIHRALVIIGDLKPDNILVSRGVAYIIDFDSAAMPDYPAIFFTEEYLDPRIKGSLRAQGPFPFDEESDWFALGVIAFQLFFGIVPWLGVHPNLSKAERAFYYSVVGIDPDVVPPRGKMRPIDWLDRRPRLRQYFEHLFSDDVSARYPIDYALESHFEKKFVNERYNYQVRNIGFDPILEQFTEPVVMEIKERAKKVGRGRKNEEDFLNYMLGTVRGGDQ